MSHENRHKKVIISKRFPFSFFCLQCMKFENSMILKIKPVEWINVWKIEFSTGKLMKMMKFGFYFLFQLNFWNLINFFLLTNRWFTDEQKKVTSLTWSNDHHYMTDNNLKLITIINERTIGKRRETFIKEKKRENEKRNRDIWRKRR